MKRRKTHSKPLRQPSPAQRKPFSWSWLVVAATLLVVPLIFDVYGKDNFRLPKELAFRASAIALLVVFAFYATRHSVDTRSSVKQHLCEPAVLVPLAIVAWTGITTVTSLNRMLSVESLITVLASAIFFFGCRAALKRSAIGLLDLTFGAAAANAILAILQDRGIWQPFRPLPGEPEVGAIAFLGNRNDLGSYLLLPAATALICAALSRGRRRVAYVVIAGVLAAGLIASATRTAIAAYIVAALVAAFRTGGRVRIVALITAGAIAVIILLPRTDVGRRYWTVVDAALAGKFDVAFSERVPALLTAFEMFQDRPLLGAGPGTFKWLYMRYRTDLAASYPEVWTRGSRLAQFGEAHNDHLQIAAETGIVGYALLLLAVIVCASERKPDPVAAKNRLGRMLGLPLVIGVLLLMVTQFPLQLAGPRIIILFFAAMCTSDTEINLQ